MYFDKFIFWSDISFLYMHLLLHLGALLKMANLILYIHMHTYILILHIYLLFYLITYNILIDNMNSFERNFMLLKVSHQTIFYNGKVRKGLIVSYFFFCKITFSLWHICCFTNCLIWHALKISTVNHAKSKFKTQT